jgi:hypothetical protein
MPEHDDRTQLSAPGLWGTSLSDVRVVVHTGAGSVLQRQSWWRLWLLLLADGAPSNGEAEIKENVTPVEEAETGLVVDHTDYDG